MHKPFSILLFLLIPIIAHSQEKSIINFGINFSFSTNHIDVAYGESTIKSKPGFYIEKPFNVNLFKIKFLSVAPGLEYFNINEGTGYGRSSGGNYKEIDHKSIAGYVKLIKKIEFQNISSNLYLGGFSGIHMYSSSKGEKNWWANYTQGANNRGNQSINKTGKSDFYNFIYYGLLMGFEKKFKSLKWMTPGIEFKYKPNLGKVYLSVYESRFSIFELSLNLGFNSIKD